MITKSQTLKVSREEWIRNRAEQITREIIYNTKHKTKIDRVDTVENKSKKGFEVVFSVKNDKRAFFISVVDMELKDDSVKILNTRIDFLWSLFEEGSEGFDAEYCHPIFDTDYREMSFLGSLVLEHFKVKTQIEFGNMAATFFGEPVLVVEALFKKGFIAIEKTDEGDFSKVPEDYILNRLKSGVW